MDYSYLRISKTLKQKTETIENGILNESGDTSFTRDRVVIKRTTTARVLYPHPIEIPNIEITFHKELN